MGHSLGSAALWVAFGVALYGAAVSAWAGLSGRGDAARSARNSVYVLLALVTLASAVLMRAFLARDFSLLYVFEYSSRSLSDAYAVTAFWAGQEGSLLLWLELLAAFAGLTAFLNRRRHADLMPWVIHVLMVNASFFLLLLNFVSRPFAPFPGAVPPDGNGLNPLLQNIGMIFHPPALFVGYVGLTIPFAFAIASLLAGRSDSAWIDRTHRWTVFSWFFLGVGILLGAQWAYVELGWGGYWAWDPVENASLMPWLTATALLHSVMVQERRGMMKVWNIVLVVLSYFLVIFGTFVTRSGIISSVHAFGKSSLGTFFLVFMILLFATSFALLVWRRRALRSREGLVSLLSRESGFTLGNIILTAMAVTVFWGTLFPTLSELVTGTKIAVGPPFFNRINVPIALVLLLLMGVCPLLGWKRTTADRLRRNFLLPALLAAVAAGAALAVGVRSLPVLLIMGFSAFVATVVLTEVARGTRFRARKEGGTFLGAFARLVWGNRRRYGGYVVHLGMVVIFIGLGGSALTKEVNVTLRPSEAVQIGAYTVTYESMKLVPGGNMVAVTASLKAVRGQDVVGTLAPERRFYEKREDKPTTEVSILSNWHEDLYVAMTAHDRNSGRASFRILVNPLVPLLWAGGYVLALGALLALLPGGRKPEGGGE